MSRPASAFTFQAGYVHGSYHVRLDGQPLGRVRRLKPGTTDPAPKDRGWLAFGLEAKQVPNPDDAGRGAWESREDAARALVRNGHPAATQ